MCPRSSRRSGTTSSTASSAPTGRSGSTDSGVLATGGAHPGPRCSGACASTSSRRCCSSCASASRTQHVRNRGSEAHLERLLRFADPANPNVLTVGFGRRFATYKRATLLFKDLDALRQIVCDPRAAGAVPLRRQGAPRRPAGAGPDPPHHAGGEDAGVRRSPAAGRGLRPAPRAPPRRRASTSGSTTRSTRSKPRAPRA